MSSNSLYGRRDAEIRRLAADGLGSRQIADAINGSQPGVLAYCKRNGIKVQRPHKDYSTDPRVLKMAEMFRQGLTLQEIGRQHGLTRERVRQLLHWGGIAPDEGGKSVRVEAMRSVSISKERQRQAKQEARFGVPYDLLQALRANGATRAFQQQRRTSSIRGIEWRLTLGQWWAVWQTSGKFDQRGRGIGSYCMSRIRDDGPYALGNVHVQRTEENGREAVAKWAGKEKPNKGVYCIYPGREMAWQARVGRKSLGFYASAEAAGAARAAYMSEHGLTCNVGFGRGRGWTFLARNKVRPYMVQVAGTKPTYHATQAEAEAEYARRCAEVAAKRAPAVPTPETVKG